MTRQRAFSYASCASTASSASPHSSFSPKGENLPREVSPRDDRGISRRRLTCSIHARCIFPARASALDANVHNYGGGGKNLPRWLEWLGPRGGGLRGVIAMAPLPRSWRVLVLSRDASLRHFLQHALEAAGCAVTSREGFRPSDLTAQPPFNLVLAGSTLFPQSEGMLLYQALRDAFSRSRFALLSESDDAAVLQRAEQAGLSAVQVSAEQPDARPIPNWLFFPRRSL